MKRLASPHRPRIAGSIEHVAGLDYDVLDHLLGYALRRAQVAIFRSFGEATRGMDITPPRFTALVVIGANPGLTQTVLGRVLGIARSGAMQLTDWLEEHGLAQRRHSPDDARTWGLHLTPRGEKLVARMKQRVIEEEHKRAAVLSAAERSTLLQLLDKLAG
jgi:DNA-binding MarR family transcriptional regulator